MACQLGAIPDRADGFNIKDAPAVAWCFTHQCRPNSEACMGARIAQLEAALLEIRDKAATMPNGGAWAAGLATLSLHTGPMAVEHK